MAIEFSFTPDQEAFREAARDFLQKEVAPVVAEMDEKEEFPAASVRRMQEEGYFGIPIPETYGGLGLGKVGYCLFLEELGKIDAVARRDRRRPHVARDDPAPLLRDRGAEATVAHSRGQGRPAPCVQPDRTGIRK